MAMVVTRERPGGQSWAWTQRISGGPPLFETPFRNPLVVAATTPQAQWRCGLGLTRQTICMVSIVRTRRPMAIFIILVSRLAKWRRVNMPMGRVMAQTALSGITLRHSTCCQRLKVMTVRWRAEPRAERRIVSGSGIPARRKRVLEKSEKAKPTADWTAAQKAKIAPMIISSMVMV